MRFRVPQPLHGWREFLGEVGIIVLGVLVALGAEQVAEAIHWRGEVATFRQAVESEIALDLGTYQYRMRENGCVERRLDELQSWVNDWRSGSSSTLTGPIGVPASLAPNTSVWGSRSSEIVSHMPASVLLGYSDLYDEFSNNEDHRLDERSAWLELSGFDGATQLDHHDLIQLQSLITRARFRDQRITLNALNYFRKAAKLGIRSRWDPSWAPAEKVICQPILPKGG